jgi:epoxyqueuosine reductase
MDLLEGAKSVISLAVSYLGENPEKTRLNYGRTARYAWGEDYHITIKTKIKEFTNSLEEVVGANVRTRAFVDDGPMNDRAAARRSGLGWVGKNTNVISPRFGSWILLGQVVTDLHLEPDTPLKKTCGSCVRCIDDCPTGAIVAPYVIDNTRCISYLTIELKGSIPIDLRPLVGDWVFGCDICQDVCPVNRKAESGETALSGDFKQRPGFATPDLVALLELDQKTFSRIYKNSPVKRAKRIGLQRNACVALGNNGDSSAIQPLIKALEGSESLVRAHAAWALGKFAESGECKAVKALQSALDKENDDDVLQEIKLALSP